MLADYGPVTQSLFGSLFTWGVTALGASLVFFFRSENKKLLDGSLGFAGGVMTAASFWSLLSPALEITERRQFGKFAFLPVALGFAAGAFFVHAAERLLSYMGFKGLLDSESNNINANSSSYSDTRPNKHHCENVDYPNSTKNMQISLDDNENLHINNRSTCTDEGCNLIRRRNNLNKNESIIPTVDNMQIIQKSHVIEKKVKDDVITTWRRICLLILAITVHNIPEGLAVGVGFGAIGKCPSATFESARNLALGIGIQNFPEGFAVSLPLVGLGYSKWRAFWYGQLSGLVEPFAALLGAFAVQFMEPLLPYALSFAAGAMIFVVFDDIVPESQINGNGKLASWSAMVGFVVMMSLDVGLG